MTSPEMYPRRTIGGTYAAYWSLRTTSWGVSQCIGPVRVSDEAPPDGWEPPRLIGFSIRPKPVKPVPDWNALRTWRGNKE